MSSGKQGRAIYSEKQGVNWRYWRRRQRAWLNRHQYFTALLATELMTDRISAKYSILWIGSIAGLLPYLVTFSFTISNDF